MLSFIKDNCIWFINIFYYLFAISSLFVFYFYYDRDNEILKDHYGHIFIFHVGLYVNVPIMTSLSFIKNHLFLLVWLLVLNIVDYIVSILSFISHFYRTDCPTYVYLFVYLHISTVIFLGLIVRSRFKKGEAHSNYSSI